ncbi:MAG: M1 family aminopeptidase [Acidobacteria bacterium]|nr:M1 family aminopeptidase [Acidobacteriota bacterium]
MPLRTLFIISLVAMVCGVSEGARAQSQMPGVGPGVARELARQRAQHYREVRYALDVELVPGAEMLKGRIKIGVTLDAAAGDLVLDWRVLKKDTEASERVSDITVNGKRIADALFTNEHILIPRAHLTAGANTLEMNFSSPISASGSAVTCYLDREDKSEYVYTLFVPSDASTVFPCFDQPDLKARFTLKVTAPETWKVIANTEPSATNLSINDLTTGRRTYPPEGMSSVLFRETEPISTYVFAFAAGPFESFRDDASPYGTRLFVRKSKAERARKELAEVFRLNRGALKFFEGYFDYKFPFPKYDLVIIPEFPFNGMEHAGATFLREETILFPSDPTASDLLARADVMTHEAAHQWFGDLVTMRWFDDLWLKEGFATFMGYKAIEQLLPEFDAWKVFHLRNKPLAYLTDVTKGTTPIWQEIPNLSAAKSAYGNIVYRKAPSMLRQAEFYLGAEQFQKAVRLLVKEHAYANATWDDLVRAFERTSGRKLGLWADAWVKRRGMPDVRARWSADARGRLRRLTLEQRDVLGEGGAWPMSVRVLLAGRAAGAPPEILNVTLRGAGATAVREAVGRRRPAFVFANYEDYGYGRFLLDDASRTAVVRGLGTIKDDFLRALLWGSLWDSVREAELAPADFVELAVKHAPLEEKDDVALQFVLSRAQTAFLRYLSDAQRLELASRLERMIYDRMMNAQTPGARITFFRTYREVATTGEAQKNLADILTGKLLVPGMTLRSRDRFDIARALMARETGAYVDDILKYATKQDASDDGRRYAYGAGAVVPDPTVKKKYFDQYLNDRDLAESWIEASFGPFNTPQQSRLTLPYLDPALEELPTLKRTRKIFFVNGWLAAFIGGQCSEDALAVVRGFLAREETLDRDLRLKVLEAVDGVERCVRIRTRYAAEGRDPARPAP